MGLSSNARLLTITARLTSNEYESQQITNAKLRLATESQQASDDYIHALNQQAYCFVTYDDTGNTVYSDLCANTLYTYADSKNQFVLANASGQVLVSKKDAKNFEASGNLQQFLEKYASEAVYVSNDLKTLADNVNNYIDSNGKTKWENFLDDPSNNANRANWNSLKEQALTDYRIVRSEYEDMILENEINGGIDRSIIEAKKAELDQYYEQISNYVNFGSYMEKLIQTNIDAGTATSDETNMLNGLKSYKDNLAEYNELLEKLGIDPEEAYTFEDPTKAQWYTNLWYRMNGSSSVKSSSAEKNYVTMEPELASSSTWIRDSLTQGILTIEQASYTNTNNTRLDKDNPFKERLNGIRWDTKIFSSCPDIIQRDDSSRLSKAEAQYTKRTAEINAKDEKFQRKINLLNTEHQALQTEYESVKSAMDKNIERSFKTFNS